MSNIRERLSKLRDAIAKKAAQCGRSANEISLVAVTKFANVEDIRAAYDAGHRDFAENYLQKVLPKMEVLPTDINWHFIGAVQKNKINKMLGKFVLVHSIDSQEIADAFQLRAARENFKQHILIEVKTSDEEAKHGIEPQKVFDLAYHIKKECTNLVLDGIMTVAPFTSNREKIARSFDTARKIRDELELEHLSMGMTNDWEIAIEYGATILRIGTAIFG